MESSNRRCNVLCAVDNAGRDVWRTYRRVEHDDLSVTVSERQAEPGRHYRFTTAVYIIHLRGVPRTLSWELVQASEMRGFGTRSTTRLLPEFQMGRVTKRFNARLANRPFFVLPRDAMLARYMLSSCVRPCVRPSVRHKSVFCQDVWTEDYANNGAQ